MDGWNTIISFWDGPFSAVYIYIYISFREETCSGQKSTKQKPQIWDHVFAIPTIYHPFEFHLEMKNSVPLKTKAVFFLQSMSIIHESADCAKCFLKRVLTKDQAFNLIFLLNGLFLYTWKLQNRIPKTRSLKVFDDVFPAVYFRVQVDVPFCTWSLLICFWSKFFKIAQSNHCFVMHQDILKKNTWWTFSEISGKKHVLTFATFWSYTSESWWPDILFWRHLNFWLCGWSKWGKLHGAWKWFLNSASCSRDRREWK